MTRSDRDREHEAFAGLGDPARPRRDAVFLYPRIAGILFAACLLYAIACRVPGANGLPFADLLALNPACTINTFGMLLVMAVLAGVAAYNPGARPHALMLLAIAHAITLAAAGWLYAAYPANPLAPGHHRLLLAIAGINALMLAVTLALRGRTRVEGRAEYDAAASEANVAESTASKVVRWYYLFGGVGFAAVALGAVVQRIIAVPGSEAFAVYGGPDPMVISTMTKFGTYSALCFVLYRHTWLRRYLAPAIILALGVSIIAAFLYTASGADTFVTPFGAAVGVAWYAPLDLALATSALIGLLAFRRRHYRRDYLVTALSPAHAEYARALREALLADAPQRSHREMLLDVQRCFIDVDERRKSRHDGVRGALRFAALEYALPALTLRPPFSTLAREEARWMLRTAVLRPFHRRRRALVRPIADALHAAD